MRYRLRTLLIFLTVVGIGAGLAVNFPRQAIRWGLVGVPFVPAVVLMVVLHKHSRRPIVLSTMSVAGGLVGLLLFRLISLQIAKPAVIKIPGESQLYVDMIELGLQSMGLILGTLLFGGVLLIEEFRGARRASR